MINPAYTSEILERAHYTLTEEEMVLLHEVLTPITVKQLRRRLEAIPKQKHHHPLRHSWHRAKDRHVMEEVQEHEILDMLQLVTGKQYRASLYILKKGDFSLLHDALEKEQGYVAFYDLSTEWHHSWGGYIGVGGQQYDITPNSLLILELHGHHWFVKRINHMAKAKKVLLVFREK